MLENSGRFRRGYKPQMSQDSIRRVQGSSDLFEVVDATLNLCRAGFGYKALCPFHSEDAPSFTVSVDRQTFKCFGCGVGGGVIDFVMLYHKVGFQEAVERLAKRSGIHIEYDPDYF